MSTLLVLGLEDEQALSSGLAAIISPLRRTYLQLE
jgi:hypothetical protein